MILEKVKRHLFDAKAPKEVAQARDALLVKSKTYYSNEALNPRPKRGRPPKQIAKVELEPQFTLDIYTTVPPTGRAFLYLPDVTASSVTFSAKFDTEQQLLANLRGATRGVKVDTKLEALSQRLESLRHLSARLGSIHETGSDRDERLIKAFNTTKVEIEEKEEEGKSRIASLAHGFIPKKGTDRQLPASAGGKPPAMKKVTPLTKPKKKGQ